MPRMAVTGRRPSLRDGRSGGAGRRSGMSPGVDGSPGPALPAHAPREASADHRDDIGRRAGCRIAGRSPRADRFEELGRWGRPAVPHGFAPASRPTADSENETASIRDDDRVFFDNPMMRRGVGHPSPSRTGAHRGGPEGAIGFGRHADWLRSAPGIGFARRRRRRSSRGAARGVTKVNGGGRPGGSAPGIGFGRRLGPRPGPPRRPRSRPRGKDRSALPTPAPGAVRLRPAPGIAADEPSPRPAARSTRPRCPGDHRANRGIPGPHVSRRVPRARSLCRGPRWW